MINLGGGRPGTATWRCWAIPASSRTAWPRTRRHQPVHAAARDPGFARRERRDGHRGRAAPLGHLRDDADDPDSPERLLTALAAMLVATWHQQRRTRWRAAVVVLNPDHATALAARLRPCEVSEALCELAVNRRGDLRRVNASMARRGSTTTSWPPSPARTTSSCSTPAGAGSTRWSCRPGAPGPTPTARSPSGSTSTRPATSRAPAADRPRADRPGTELQSEARPLPQRP